ncbi:MULTISPECIES: hypothetical protein [unclassified Pseudomonas]
MISLLFLLPSMMKRLLEVGLIVPFESLTVKLAGPGWRKVFVTVS